MKSLLLLLRQTIKRKIKEEGNFNRSKQKTLKAARGKRENV